MIVLENNVIMTSEKVGYGELQGRSGDIGIRRNGRKVEFLEGIGYGFRDEPEVSLAAYLRYLKQSTPIQTV